ncbi:MAG TPA: diguanylate cyclase [Candidatus Acidoferrales bacterium]|nr:diguanylate cyclase [Candidatus Acidoferrales bacterium]
MEFLNHFFSSGDFVPHGTCFLWNWRLILLHVTSDGLIALAYMSIPIALVRIVRKRKDLPFNWMFLCFGLFIVACGLTHAMEVVTLWQPVYWLSGTIKSVTAAASVATAVLLVRLVPQALAIPNPTELIRANETLRESEENYRLLVEHTKDYGVFRLDTQGKVASWNPGSERTLGYHADEGIGQHFSRFFTEEDVLNRKPEEELRAAEAAGFCEHEGWRVRKDGSLFWANVIVTALRDPSGNVCGFAKVMRDLTRRRQAEEELRRLNQELETRVAARTAALENANRRLGESVDALEERTREISVLSEMAGTLQACQGTEEVFRVIERAIPRLFPGQPGSLAFASSEKPTVKIVASWGGKTPAQLAFSPVDCWAMRNGRLHTFDETSPAGLRCRHLDMDAPPGSICIPLLAQGEALGVLSLDSRLAASGPAPRGTPSPKSDDRLAAALGEQVGTTLANLRLRETLRLQAIRDPLTGLFNRRYMEESLDRDLRRALRGHSSLGVILLDIDHFKLFNDSYGHAGGDAVLRTTGGLLQNCIRAEDIACRYGGEEFALILIEASLAVTLQRAEALCQAVNRMSVKNLGRKLGNITFSIGVAVCPDHGNTVEGLLRSADLALYDAKARGRNRVVVAGQERSANTTARLDVPTNSEALAEGQNQQVRSQAKNSPWG